MHIRHCKLREKQQDRLAEFFVAGVTARAAADLLGIHRNSAALFYHRLRQIIAAALGDPPAMEGEIEVDESYFGGYCKGKRERGAALAAFTTKLNLIAAPLCLGKEWLVTVDWPRP